MMNERKSDMAVSRKINRAKGPVAWMAKNPVAANVLMIILLVGGFLMAFKIKQEVFPEFNMDTVSITTSYPGASPEEVEEGIVQSIEEAIQGIDGVKEVTSTAGEGMASVNAELLEGVDQQKVYQDIKQEVDRITTFPEDAEEPQVTLATHRHEVLWVMLYGEASEWVLRDLADNVRDELLQDPNITQIDVSPSRDYEIGVEVPQATLRQYRLTLADIAQKLSLAAVEVPGGSVKTQSGEILLRMKERRDWAREFASLPIITSPEGTQIRLGDIATVRDTFEETDQVLRFNGKPSVGLEVFRVGDQTPIGVSDAVQAKLAEIGSKLPPGIYVDINRDMSDVYRQRLQLLLRNAMTGLILVFLLLGLFLEFKLAFWVTMGIPTSFLGAFLFLPEMDVSINMISLFAFIIALGIVVDDAIVAGENIFEYRKQGKNFLEASIFGVREVAGPVSFSILTNIITFLPLWFVPGIMGKFFKVIPLVVTTVFLISWIEALFILPAHLAHSKEGSKNFLGRLVLSLEQRFGSGVLKFIHGVYGPFLDRCLRLKYLTVAIGVAVVILAVGYVASGRIGFVMMPKVESDQANVTAVLPYGSPVSRAIEIRDRLVESMKAVAAENGGTTLVEKFSSEINANVATVTAIMTDPEVRPIGTAKFSQLWRERTGPIRGLESLRFESDRGGPGRGAELTVELSHRDVAVLDRAGQDLAAELEGFAITKDIDDGYTPGKQQLDFAMLPEGRSLGLTAGGVARQVRNAFYGAEAIRQQRGRHEVKVMVRYPKSERISEYDIEELMIRTPGGRDVPLREVAKVKRGRAYTSINHRLGRRTITVSSDVDPPGATDQIIQALDAEVLPKLVARYPGLTYTYEGKQADMRDSLRSLLWGFVLAMLAIYATLAIPLKSYSLPLIIMVSIPFGIVGAVLGHLMMGYDLSIVSVMGLVALSGVVVNDSLILIELTDRLRREGSDPRDAVHWAGVRRFRPILLTTLTTFGGLAPMIFETSREARFLIPMAISLGFGILFATLISLVLVPCLYLMIQDFLRWRESVMVVEA
jgi:multidrug efflux pump subunit AcrB